MEGLADQARRSQEYSDECAKCTMDLSQEVASLRETVSSLEKKLSHFVENAATLSEGSKSSENFVGVNEITKSEKVDPYVLLERGLISEAVECALELKDTDKLVALLEKMSHGQVTGKCNRLVQLCTVQQLAGDLTQKEPQEGLSKRVIWLKTLVMSLIFAPPSVTQQDSSAEAYLTSVFSDMIVCLRATESRLVTQITTFQEDGDDDAIIPYSAAITDLQMLIAIVATKVK